MKRGEKPGEFGAKVREVRNQRGLTVAQLADKIGMLEGSLAQVERGRTKFPSAKTRERLELWLADPTALDAASGNTLLQRRVALIEARLARLEEKCDEWDERSDSIQLTIDDLVQRGRAS